MQQPREEIRMKREKKRYFLTKMIKKSRRDRNLSRSVDRQKSEKMIWDEISDTGMMPG